jgi:replicative DNA helicase
MAAAFDGSGNGNPGGPARGGRGEGGAAGDRVPPHHLEAERGVLGSILLDNDVMHDIASFLRAEDFYRDAHQVIYGAIRELYDRNKGIDAVTLAEQLRRQGQFDQVGGDETLTEIVTSIPHAANGKYYAEIVKQKATNRQLIESATEIIRDGYSNQFTAQELLESAERKIFAIAEDQIRGETLELEEVVKKAMELIAFRYDSGGKAVTGLGTGLDDLDNLTGGFQPGQLIIVAARPSMGKTALALNICDHVGINLNIPVLFVSLEMGDIEIGERLLCARSRVSGHKVKTGVGLGIEQMKQLTKAYTEMCKSGQIFIDSTPARNMMQIAASARRIKRRSHIGLIVVDYLQLVDSDESRDSRQEQIAKISRRLKTMARELKVPVIALSQLNRAVESREDKRPRMADLRESGAIEQDADIVLLLHRPDYYDSNDQPGVAELIIAKNRNGPTDRVKLTFERELTRFANFSDLAPPFDDGGSF